MDAADGLSTSKSNMDPHQDQSPQESLLLRDVEPTSYPDDGGRPQPPSQGLTPLRFLRTRKEERGP
ncbi:hypothetical protein TRIUR3_14368 [Triticum urartu]|uniref:Uncharacterized protein n=1 Tax=Triticum urartu TaxID=4572 RepID=M7ZDU6_TRIUA|nr:hypothetical protein TRIUR3_14368 [Triticum urartu]